MADSINVFIDTDISLEELAKEVEKLLGVKFEFQKDEYEEWYAVRTKEGLFTIGTHDFDNDQGINFEDYKYDIAFWENRDNTPEHREELQQEVGRKIFETLKSTNKFPLMYVYDVQKKLDEYHPLKSSI